jgi:hypothetical protein
VTRSARRARAALVAAVALLALAPATASAGRGPVPAGAFDVAPPHAPVRDVVLHVPSASASRAMATASSTRFPVNDGRGGSVQISVTDLCQTICTDAKPQKVANFLGTVIHGDEMNLLRVDLVTPSPGEMSAICGPQALACYFSGQNRMVISGNADRGSDGSSREFNIAHEYGHHLAQHRLNPPFSPTIGYGTKRWASFERVCQGARRGIYFPGDQGSRYFENPGEAFAEAFAFNRFPDAPVQWAWIDSLRPGTRAFKAIRQDTLRPWTRRSRIVFSRELRDGVKTAVQRIRTPLDGMLTVRLAGPRGSEFDLLLRDGAGRVVRRSEGLGSNERISYLICGQARFKAVVRRTDGAGGAYNLVARRP